MSSDATPPPATPAPVAAPSRLERTCALVGLLSGREGEVVRALPTLDDQLTACCAAFPALAAHLTPDDLTLALSICSKARGLCQPRTAGLWTRIAGLASTRTAWQPKMVKGGVIILPMLAVAILVPSLLRGRSYDAWAQATAKSGGTAASLQTTAVLLQQDAGSISAFPAGAYVHAQAALSDLDAANHTLGTLWVLGNDPTSLHLAFKAHPEASRVEAHDDPLLHGASLKVHTARSELEIAHHVLGYAQQWANLELPSSLPPSLAGAWSDAASAMDSALHTGDATALQRSDDRLNYLLTAGQQLAALQSWTQDFDADDLRVVQPIIDAMTAAIASDDREAVNAAIDRWQALRDARPLSYGLLVSASPTDTHGVQRQFAGATGRPADYLIVKAVDAAGQPVTLPVYDTERHTLTHVQIFGVQVSPETYDAARAQISNTHAALLLAQKAIGQVAPSYTVPVLAGRITHW